MPARKTAVSRRTTPPRRRRPAVVGGPVDEGGGPSARTRARLLEAAGAVFAEHGYRGGSVREICRRARANVSAVGYHFGSKAELYKAVLRSTQQYAGRRYPIAGLAEQARTDPEAALHGFIRTFLCRLLDRGRPAWHGRLMTRELADPSPAFAVVVDEVAGPMFTEAAAIVARITGQPADCERTRLRVASIMGQCSVHRSARALLAAMRRGAAPDIEELADHVTAFSMAGLRAETKRNRRSSAGNATNGSGRSAPAGSRVRNVAARSNA